MTIDVKPSFIKASSCLVLKVSISEDLAGWSLNIFDVEDVHHQHQSIGRHYKILTAWAYGQLSSTKTHVSENGTD